MPDLETVDLDGVEILHADVRIHGVGSPPEGDVWTTDDLRAMAEAAQELEQAGEWRVAAKVGAEPLGRSKLGHGKKQTLLSSTAEAGEMPAAGWLANQRVSDDGTKLLADIKDVPRKVADLIKAKAYRTRSAELGSVTSQKTGKRHEWVVTGLAWLGGKMPAVRTLDDVVALYEADEDGEAVERRFAQFDDVSEPSTDELRDALAALATESAREFQTELSLRGGRADIRRVVPEKTYTDEQKRSFAEATGVELDKVTDEMLAAAGVAEVETEPKRDLEADERMRKLEQDTRDANDRARKLEEELRVERRDAFVTKALEDGRIEPGQREFVEELYDAKPDKARAFVESLPVNEDFAREFGAEGGGDEDAEEKRELEEKAIVSRMTGVPVEELV